MGRDCVPIQLPRALVRYRRIHISANHKVGNPRRSNVSTKAPSYPYSDRRPRRCVPRDDSADRPSRREFLVKAGAAGLVGNRHRRSHRTNAVSGQVPAGLRSTTPRGGCPT